VYWAPSAFCSVESYESFTDDTAAGTQSCLLTSPHCLTSLLNLNSSFARMQLWFKYILPVVIVFWVTNLKPQNPSFKDQVVSRLPNVLLNKQLQKFPWPCRSFCKKYYESHLKILYFEDTAPEKDKALKKNRASYFFNIGVKSVSLECLCKNC